MKLSDFFIVYLACGAPFGVLFYLQHRNKKISVSIYLQSLAVVFVWIPYAVRFLHDFVTSRFRRRAALDLTTGKLENLQKQISESLYQSDSAISLFELREILERYRGLTIARNSADSSHSKSEEEIFRIALRQNIGIGAACLHRRNLQQIERHQISARRDFLRLIADLAQTASDKSRLHLPAVELAKTLDDDDAIKELEKIFAPIAIKENFYESKKSSSNDKVSLRLRAAAVRKN